MTTNLKKLETKTVYIYYHRYPPCGYGW